MTYYGGNPPKCMKIINIQYKKYYKSIEDTKDILEKEA